MSNPDRALRVAAGVDPMGEGRFLAHLSPHYTIGDNHPNGGYLQCVIASAGLAEAAEQGSTHTHVTAQTTNYVGSPSLGMVELQVDVRKVGRAVTFAHVTMTQEGRVMTESVLTLGTLSDEPLIRYVDAAPPDVAPLEDIPSPPATGDVSIRSVIEQRLDPRSVAWVRGEVSDRGEILGWMRLNDGESQWDPWSLLFAADALPPATFPLGSHMWTPTLQLTTFVRGVPRGEWLRARQWCVVVADNLVDERCELFDETDQLVAVASQLAMVRFPHATTV